MNARDSRPVGTGRMLAKALRGSWRASPPAPDFTADELARLAPSLLASGSGPLGWWRIRNSPLSETVAGMQLRDAFRVQVLATSMRRERIVEAFARLRDAGIEPVLIKGWAAARLYPQDGLRGWTDIDLCVAPSQLPAAESLLDGPHLSRQEVDLTHTEITDPAGLLERSQLVRLGDVPIRIPCPEDHLRLLCVHALKHDVFRPQWLCDIAAAVEHRPANFSWPLLLGEDRRVAGWIACAVGLAQSLLGADLAGTPLQAASATLPGWVTRCVLKVWDRPEKYKFAPDGFFVDLAREPGRIGEALLDRWARPLRASIVMNAPINAFPRFPIQVALYCRRAVKLVKTRGLGGKGLRGGDHNP